MSTSSDAGREKAMQAVTRLKDNYVNLSKKWDRPLFDDRVMRELKLLDASLTGTTLFELKCSRDYTNLTAIVHGGAVGMIFDMCSSLTLAPVATPGMWEGMGGVSRAMNISFLKAIPAGTLVHIKCQVISIGKTMVLVRGTIESPDGKNLYASVEHHKVNAGLTQADFDKAQSKAKTKPKL